MTLNHSKLISSCILKVAYTYILDDSAFQNKCDGLLCAAYTPVCKHSLLPASRQFIKLGPWGGKNILPCYTECVPDSMALAIFKGPENVVLQLDAGCMVHQNIVEKATGDQSLVILRQKLKLADNRRHLAFVLGEDL